MINDEDYEALQEQLEDLRDARLAEEVYEAVRSGRMKSFPWREVKEQQRKKRTGREEGQETQNDG